MSGLESALNAEHGNVARDGASSDEGHSRTASADESLRRSALQSLAADRRLRGCDISLQALTGVVVLEGEVPDAETARAAGLAAWRATGVRDVCNCLQPRTRKSVRPS
ncbi:BON domain-containing protein [Motilibacter deserti]|uniref:BON domain-containing protein n=1 Tax=Motilibacter deserti TaxID=2714956 RepID=A0ABX0GWI4_9ACTN|nr:BON domain-containing protein [Motilibacter deserti]NHC13994.1 BON domain-containing protein [Motilibacter deserti]